MKHTDYRSDNVSTAIGVPFFHSTVEENEKVLEQQRTRSRELVDAHPSGYGASFTKSCGSWNSIEITENIIEREEVFSPLIGYIEEYLPEYLDAARIRWDNCELALTDAWLNANPKGNVQECHIHPHCYIAGVYYVHIPEGKGSEFVLDNPLSYEHEVGVMGDSLLEDSVIDVQSGDMILFPSNREHHTRVNYSDEFRYSLAFNISVAELLPEYFKGDEEPPWENE